ncbi:2Fe-2S iron-sulfur cluster binding domain-containing protein [Seongchinamella unica]|uniref:2Fe-2S iron-sulfur cluster binding domain-containing protein n=1 Tax=Seongchinamella unica TaxID=2547392 RepID=A0A4R5LT34_9GAMM|nr:2Fe-2S iron-sulfur cluster binding domain-containing protein [Seongchinamella unica]TDG14061.1 2Fe-2S iron-sulfur cluster binding domain-containing protein [Seongchinamella unica]
MKHTISLLDSGESFRCKEEQHLLQGMQTFQVGAPLLKVIPVGCRGGGCGICRVRVLSGSYEAKKMSIKHITEEDMVGGIVLACRVYPRDDLEVEVLTPPDSQSTQES